MCAVLTANSQIAVAGGHKFLVEIIDTDIIYAGAYVAAGSRAHATAATRGRALPMVDDTAGYVPLGHALQQATGATSAARPPEAEISVEGRIVKNMTVTDDANDISDQFRWVYAIDDGTFTVARPVTMGFPIGITTRYIAANTFNVKFFSFGELCAIALGGAGKALWNLGVVVAEAAGAGNVLTGIECPHHGRITSVYTICASAPADADMSILLNLEIGATNVTGGVITLDFTDLLGAKQAGTAITALNVVHEGDLIDVESASVTAGTVGDGIYNLYAMVDLEPGT